MKRSRVDLAAVADWHNLASAFGRAAAGCRGNSAAERFRDDLDANLHQMQQEIMQGNVRVGAMTSFCIRDPKIRIIHAPCFRERVLHHALIAHVGPILDRALVDDTFACRKGKGTLAAVQRCQHHLRRFSWFVQIDIRSFFAAIDHEILLSLLSRKFKNPELLKLLEWIIFSFSTEPGKGLPIGALTSQHFANYYLAGLDRLLLEAIGVRGMVRYMDDLLWCCDSKEEARKSLHEVLIFLANTLRLAFKEPVHIGRSVHGTLFCGLRVLPGCLLLSRRRKRRYSERRQYWENQYAQGKISIGKLQAGYAAVLGMTMHTDAIGWRRAQLRRKPIAKLLEEV